VGILALVAVFARNDSLIPIVTCQMLELSLRYGVNQYSAYALSCFAFALTMTADFDGAFRFGTLALRLMNRFREDPKALVTVYGVFYHIKKPILDAFKPTLHGYYLAFSQGDLTFAGQASITHVFLRYVAGAPLNIIVDDIFSFCDQLKSYNQKMVWDLFIILQRTCLELTNRSDEIVRLTGRTFENDDAFESYINESTESKGMFQHCLHAFPCRFYLGNLATALKYAKYCWQINGLQGAYALVIEYYLFSALVSLENWKKIVNPVIRHRYWLQFRKYHRCLQTWTTKGNPNTGHLVKLLYAEFLANRKHIKPDEIKSYFDMSIARASRAGFLHNAALANERAGIYFLNRRDMYWARHYLGRAKCLYADWGAIAKVTHMEATYGPFADAEMSEFQRSVAIAGRSRQDMITLVETLRDRPRNSIT
jgi:histidine kinase